MKGEKNMNKLFTKIVGAALGLTMAIGVGVAVASSQEAVPVHAAATEVATGTLTSTASYTGGTGTQSATKKTGYYQDVSSGTTYFQVLNSSAWWTTTPSSISFTANLAGGSAKDPLTNNVQVQLLGSGGSTLGSATTVTTKVTATSAPYTVSIPVQNNVYGVKLTHAKESSFNVRFYSFSLSYEAGSSGKTETTTTVTAAGSKTTLDVTASPADTVQLSATVTPASGTLSSPSVTWSSGSTSVATVSSTGLVTAVAKGTARITATYAGDSTFNSSSGYIDIKVANPNEAVFNFAELAEANSWVSGTAYTPVVVNGTTLSTSSGGNNAKYYSSDDSWRMYNGGSLTITPPSGKSISAVSSTPSYTFSIANDGSSASASFTSTTNFTEITVSLTAAKVLDTISASITDSEKVWRVNDVVTASDLTVTPHYTDGTDGTPITDGTGVTVTNGTLSIAGDNTVNVSYGGKPTTVTVNALSSTVVAWSITGSIGDTVKSTNYNLSGLTLHAWYDLGKTDEASSSVANLYELVANPTTAGNTADPNNEIDVEVYLKTDTGHSNRLALFEDVAAPIVNAAKGSEDNPYNVSEGMAAAIAQGSTASSSTSYVVGYVAYKASNNQIFLKENPDEIDASSTPSTSEKNAMLCVYKSSGITGVGDVSVGDQVTVSGCLQYYNSTQPEFNSGAIVSYVAETMTINKTVATDTLIINSAFSYSGVVSIDYTHKTDVANANALVTFSGYNMASTGSQTVTISYSDAALGKEASTTYTLNVEYAAVSTVTLNHSAITVEPVSETDFSVTLNSNVNPSNVATWTVANDVGSSLDLNNYAIESTGNLTATLTCIGDSTDSGVLIVTATVGGISDTCTVTVTGDAYVTFNKDSIQGIVGATLNNSVTVTPVGLGTPTGYTWSIKSGEATDVVNITTGSATSTLTFLKAGSTVLHVVVTDGTDSAEGDVSVSVIKSLNTITSTSITPGTATWTVDDSTSQTSGDTVDVDIDANIHMLGDKASGSTAFRFWSDGIRSYAGNSVTFTPSNGAVIKTITLPTVGGTCSDEDATKDGNVWTIKNGSSAITFTSLSKGTITANIVVEYEITSSGSNIANTNYNAQKAVIEFAEDLTTRLNAVCLQDNGGTNVSALNTAWTNIQSTYNTKRNALSSSDKDVFDALIANATKNESGDSLQKALSSYDFVYAKYSDSLTAGDFLHSTSGRDAVQASARVVPFANVINGANGSAIIIIISLIGLTAIGGYFFIRKRKEQ